MDDPAFKQRLDSNYRQYQVGTFGNAFLDLDEIAEVYNSGQDIVITKYPRQMMDTLLAERRRKSEFWNNISLGVSFRDNRQN
jgi:hypothetical protein